MLIKPLIKDVDFTTGMQIMSCATESRRRLDYNTVSFSGNTGIGHDSGHFVRGAAWLYLQVNTTVLQVTNNSFL